MRVSVVIPTYNSGPLVVEAVESVLAQTRPADEILVVDDGSTDDTEERLARFGSAVQVIRKENGGVATARNRGVAAASGDVIAFLDADDVWHPNKLEFQCVALQANPHLGMLGAKSYDWPAAAHPAVEVGTVPPVVEIPLAKLVVRNAFTTSAVMVRTDVLRTVGEFDVEQFGTEDFDLWLRIAQRVPVGNLRVALTGYRAATAGSLSKNAARMEAGRTLIHQRLETAGVFRGRPLLRRKVLGSTLSAAAYEQFNAGRPGTAARRVLRSLLTYPLPLWPPDVPAPFARLRLLLAMARGKSAQAKR